MKDVITFPIVGSKFTDGSPASISLEAGVILRLELEPDNVYDPYAVKVYAGDKHIGYVPNKGMSCNQCWSYIAPTDQFCPKCDASYDAFVRGGLAYRLVASGALTRPYGCWLDTVSTSEYSPWSAKLILE